MTRKLPIIIVFTLLFFFFQVRGAHAFGIQQNSIDMIGVNCGIPGAAAPLNKCCSNLVPKVELGIWTGTPADITLAPLNLILTALEYAANFFIGSFGNKINETFIKYYGKKNAYCVNANASTEDPKDPSCICIPTDQTSLTKAVVLCDPIINADEKAKCKDCMLGNAGESKGGVWTSIGCMYGDMGVFITKNILTTGIGLAGIAALFCIIFSAFQMQTSGGNPEKIKKTQEMLTSCIMGLLLIVFSVFILRLIGVDILRIPGFK